jgi:sugar phosphate permease
MKRLQWREFGLIYIAYMGFLLTRKNYGFWLRSVISELGYEKGQAGLLGSALEVTYGTCAFLNGVVVRCLPRPIFPPPSISGWSVGRDDHPSQPVGMPPTFCPPPLPPPTTTTIPLATLFATFPLSTPLHSTRYTRHLASHAHGCAAAFPSPLQIDSRSPKHLLVGGLVLSALLNIAIARTDTLPLMVCIWAANGAVQSLGWPSITNVFLAWFPDPSSRGAWYSLLSTCQNAGAALVPLLVSASVSTYGWRSALYVPAATSTCVAVLLALMLYGSPQAAAGAPPSTKAKPSAADLAHTMRHQVSTRGHEHT